MRRHRGARRGCSSELHELPGDAAASPASRAHQYERAVLDLVEAGVLQHRVGETFDGVVVDVDEKDPTRGDVIVQEPAVEAPVSGPATTCRSAPTSTCELVEADTRTRTVRFEVEPVTRTVPYTGPRMSRPGGRGEETRRGRSGLHRARWWVTPTRGDPRDSATENRPPPRLGGAVRVKRWCKRPPALRVTGAAR